MPNVNKMFPSKFLSAGDLQGQNITVTIARLELEDIGGHDRKYVVYFQGKQKGLVLNKTNSRTIASLHGAETDGWIGKSITLFSAWVEFKGDTVEAIRVRQTMPNGAATPQQRAQAAQAPLVDQTPTPALTQTDDVYSDDIPFK